MADALEALRAALGPGCVELGAVRVPGATLEARLSPESGEQLAATLAELAARRIGARVQGGGSHAEAARAPRGARVLLETRRLSKLDTLDLDEGVLHAQAGTPLRVIREALAGSGFELPLDPPGRSATLGGTLATAASGPRRLGYGAPRDAVLGIEVVLGDGSRTRAGGRVVKNVTGYDLMKLHVGAWGTLGVIEGAWLRLRPVPETTALLRAELAPGEEALALALLAARATTARAAALLAPALAAPRGARSGRALLFVELAGDAPAVQEEQGALERRARFEASSAEELEALRQLEGEGPDAASLWFRLGSRVSRLAAVCAELEAAGAALLVEPGSGLVFAAFPATEAGARVESVFRAVAQAAALGEGPYRLERVPEALLPLGRDASSPPRAPRALLRALRQRFDPAGILNPGCLVAEGA